MTTATKAGGAVLPVVGWTIPNFALYVSDAAKRLGHSPGADVPLTPHAPAQATIDELRAEVERLTRERWVAIQRELDALKAKQIDVDAVMRLAEEYARSDVCCVLTAETDDYRENFRIRDAAREALRAELTKDRT